MNERPILFSGSMVRAILDGRKTQTRRVATSRKENGIIAGPAAEPGGAIEAWGGGAWNKSSHQQVVFSPYGRVGDRLWVKETHAFYSLNFNHAGCGNIGTWHPSDRDVCCHYREGCPSELAQRFDKWRPSIFMPRWASRITLQITMVGVERLQDISCEDALAEGIDHYTPGVTAGERGESEADPRTEYQALWESINGPGSWKKNPFVWVLDFKHISP